MHNFNGNCQAFYLFKQQIVFIDFNKQNFAFFLFRSPTRFSSSTLNILTSTWIFFTSGWIFLSFQLGSNEFSQVGPGPHGNNLSLFLFCVCLRKTAFPYKVTFDFKWKITAISPFFCVCLFKHFALFYTLGEHGIRSKYATLSVLKSPDPPKILQGDSLVATEDHEIELECVSENGKPAAEVSNTILLLFVRLLSNAEEQFFVAIIFWITRLKMLCISVRMTSEVA